MAPKPYIVRITRGRVERPGDSYTYYELRASSGETQEEAARKVLEILGITDPENYDITVA